MSKLNLLIDFNNILMRSLSTPGLTFYNSRYDNDKDLNDIIKKLSIDICYNIRLFSPDRVFILCDSSNAWRKDILPADENGYKANRKKDDDKDWNNLWKTIDDYHKLLNDKHIPVSKIDRAEADDLAALWKQRLYEYAGESIVFVSSDKDWRQLIDFDSVRNCFCAVFNPTINNKGRKKLFINDDTCKFLNKAPNDADKIAKIFGDINNLSSAKGRLKNAISGDSKIDIELVDSFNVLLHKIFEGDDGDNVPSYYDYYKTTKRGTISTGVTPSQVNKLCEAVAVKNSNDLMINADEIKHQLEVIMKMDLPVDGYDRIQRQRILVELNPVLFPDNITKEFNKTSSDLYNIVIANIKDLRWRDLLANTKFYNENIDDKPIVNTVFSDFGSNEFDKYFKSLF